MTDSYSLVIKRSAERELRGIAKPDLRRITDRIRRLAKDPRPSGCEKLAGRDRYRVRQGEYRIVYAVNDGSRSVEVVRIGHRREVYRDRS